ncbi:MAG: hypothetical protein ABIR79_12465 [Candidatus Binatia bacterium]
MTLTGPGARTDVRVSEGSGDLETVGQGNWICPMTSLSVTPSFQYRNRATTPEGIRVLAAKSGAAGKARIRVAAKGSNLDLPALPLSPPVTVQVSNGATCWSATFTTAITNPLSTTRWTAKND